ncbi:MAG: aminotransferase class V-fold PLP-dependent enzyme, partial [Nanoarchaeota archaeon]
KLRSGTENVPAITGFGKATEIISEKDIENIEKLQKYLINELLKIPKVELNGPPLGEHRLCNNINVTFTNIEGESILYLLEMGGICTSTGSACMSNTLEPSHVLNAIGISHLKSNASLRITISKYTTKEEIDEFLQVIPGIVQKLRAMSPITQKEEEEN